MLFVDKHTDFYLNTYDTTEYLILFGAAEIFFAAMSAYIARYYAAPRTTPYCNNRARSTILLVHNHVWRYLHWYRIRHSKIMYRPTLIIIG
jgi:hypothetical protein